MFDHDGESIRSTRHLNTILHRQSNVRITQASHRHFTAQPPNCGHTKARLDLSVAEQQRANSWFRRSRWGTPTVTLLLKTRRCPSGHPSIQQSSWSGRLHTWRTEVKLACVPCRARAGWWLLGLTSARRGLGLLGLVQRLVPCMATLTAAPTALMTKCTVPLATTIAMHATPTHALLPCLHPSCLIQIERLHSRSLAEAQTGQGAGGQVRVRVGRGRTAGCFIGKWWPARSRAD